MIRAIAKKPMPQTLPDFLAALAAQPARTGENAIALIDRDRAVGYAALDAEARRVARGLRDIGIGPGMRVAIWLPNVPAWLAVLFACARLGAIAVSINTRFKSHEVQDIVGRSGCCALVYWPGFRGIDFTSILAECHEGAMRDLRTLIAYGEDDAISAGDEVPGRTRIPYSVLRDAAPLQENHARADSGCVIFTTSGTTKAPKFVLHDQKTVIRHAIDVARGFGYAAADARILLSAPLCGVFGFCNAMAALGAMRPLVMYPGFDAKQSAEGIRRHRVTHTNCTDDMIAQMLAAVAEEQPFPSAHFFGYAAFSPAQADLPARADARGLRLVGLYGSSELQALLARQDDNAPLAERTPAGGRPVSADTRIRARDPESNAVLAHGAPGELEFLAPSVMAGYFNDEDATAAAFTGDGWFRSGDLGYTTQNGGFVYLARLGDAIRLSGFLVSPAEIEEVLQEHAGIVAAQVVGATTREGLKPVAFVTLERGTALDEAALIAHCREKIAGFKVPARIVALDAFPVTPSANATKIQKSKLRKMAQALFPA